MFDKIDNKILKESEWVFDRLANAEDDKDRAYYQGMVDGLATARRVLLGVKASA